ncbi:MAG TPA: nucleotidyl transferase AbiEii/AbiGii toxin family protein [Cellulomonas sp.]
MSTPPPPLRPRQVLDRLADLGRGESRPAAELYTLYTLERFLDRLGRTEFREDFVLKGGILLAAYRLRRPTSDIDMQAVDLTLDVAHMNAVIEAVAGVTADDGVALDPGSTIVRPIRDDDQYAGLRVVVREVTLHGRRIPGGLKLDVSTGDPIWPEATTVRLPGLLGGHIELLGHPLPTVIAEKTVTVLQRGTQSTRWRDYVDVRELAQRYSFTAVELRAAGESVAIHRGVDLGPLAAVTAGYGRVGQARWAAWVARQGLAASTRADLEDQVADVVALIDPIYTGAVAPGSIWDPSRGRWDEHLS